MSQKGEILPPSADGAEGRAGGNNILQIGHFHYQGNDLAELRKIAERNPALAEKIVEQRDREDSRINTSYRFGLVVTLLLMGMLLGCVTVLLVFVGIWSTVLVIALILAIALLIRVILTGEWSDTSWFGKVVGALARALGAKPSTDPE